MAVAAMTKSYSELITLPSFEERFAYLKLDGSIGKETIGYDRYLVEDFYRSDEWRRLRRDLIVRDNGCDMACEGRDIFGRIILHHINPIDTDSLRHDSFSMRDPENLVCVSWDTHQAIHYGNMDRLQTEYVPRVRGDTCVWKADEP